MKKKSIWCLVVCFLLFMSSCSLWESKDFFPPPIKFQTEKEIEITVPKDQISPESTYDKGEVPVNRTDTSVIYLKKVIQSADEPEFIILAFDILYQLEGKEQKILLPYKIEGEGDNLSYTNSIYTNNTVIDGDGKIFQDAIHISSQRTQPRV